MSKLSPSLKALINAPFARPGQAPAPPRIKEIYQRIAQEARNNNYGERPWLTLTAAATFTLNSPASLQILHSIASSPPSTTTPLAAAELIREIGLKCISFNGIPRSINCLNSFRASLPEPATAPWVADLATAPTRGIDEANLAEARQRGRALWQSVYTPLHDKLEAKLATAHPDLPVHILQSHYGPLLSDPEAPSGGVARLGRSLTSVIAIACLRAQTGVGPQVLSHVFGLRKAVEQGAHAAEGEAEAEGIARLASDEGCEWILKSVDSIAEAIGGSFASGGGRESKL
ncbi:hypothetical protein B0T19DRAFT_446676 [Cercophora scortea]|uniref:Dol-P-Man:Man(5)GlcNAc(2)-PP-Dol alpha-1,3-mannosyltransferase n=1 Tax=Cercophora scortea TaxID=314031 RepID=A0AAE0I358_9PEZI|nr:hypothetical protein B0T19DRAFT_446676 [Cercophora scortea]